MRKNRIVERQLPCRLIEFDCDSFSARSACVISVPSVLEWFYDVVNFVTLPVAVAR